MSNIVEKTWTGLISQLLLIMAATYGYIQNIFELIGMPFDHVTSPLIVRIIGVLAPPVGAVAGYL